MKPWQQRLLDAFLAAPPGTRMIMNMPRRYERSAFLPQVTDQRVPLQSVEQPDQLVL